MFTGCLRSMSMVKEGLSLELVAKERGQSVPFFREHQHVAKGIDVAGEDGFLICARLVRTMQHGVDFTAAQTFATFGGRWSRPAMALFHSERVRQLQFFLVQKSLPLVRAPGKIKGRLSIFEQLFQLDDSLFVAFEFEEDERAAVRRHVGVFRDDQVHLPWSSATCRPFARPFAAPFARQHCLDEELVPVSGCNLHY